MQNFNLIDLLTNGYGGRNATKKIYTKWLPLIAVSCFLKDGGSHCSCSKSLLKWKHFEMVLTLKTRFVLSGELAPSSIIESNFWEVGTGQALSTVTLGRSIEATLLCYAHVGRSIHCNFATTNTTPGLILSTLSWALG